MTETTTSQLPEKLQQAIQPGAKKETKLMIAQALMPVPPMVLIEALRVLSTDPDVEVQNTSIETVKKMPENILLNISQTHKSPEVLDFVAKIHQQNEIILEKILVNPLTPDSTLMNLALYTSERLSTLIGNNQVRILRTPRIAENLKKNKNMLRSEMDKLVSFLRMNGIVIEGESPELTLQEIENILQMPDDGEKIPEEYIQETKEDLPESIRGSLIQYLSSIGFSKKIKMALKGNKEVRQILIRNPNKIVCTSVIKNPSITDLEILAIAQNRTVHDEVIRMICSRSDWTKHYSVQSALANNPKTPFQLALQFARGLTAMDLKKLSKNKNAPAQLQKMAKEFFEVRRK